jgi:hypothetical protein
MPRNQFDPTLRVRTSPGQPNSRVPAGDPQIEVTGPFELDAPDDYSFPVAIQFQIVQVPRGARTDEQRRTQSDVTRERGTGEALEGQGTWSGTVKLGGLKPGKADDTKVETRGVALAVLERKTAFAFDTITWCEEVELDDTSPAQGS